MHSQHTLSREDQEMIIKVARERDYQKTMKGTYEDLAPEGFTYSDVTLNHIASEVAAARMFGLGWEDIRERDGDRGDLVSPFPIDVRWRFNPKFDLIVHDYDRPWMVMLHIRGMFPTYWAAGWIRAEEVLEHRAGRWFTGMPKPGYLVPDDEKRTNESLFELIQDALMALREEG